MVEAKKLPLNSYYYIETPTKQTVVPTFDCIKDMASLFIATTSQDTFTKH